MGSAARSQWGLWSIRNRTSSGEDDDQRWVSIFGNYWEFHNALVIAKHARNTHAHRMPKNDRPPPSYVLLSLKLCFVFSPCCCCLVCFFVFFIVIFCSTCEMPARPGVKRNNGVLIRRTIERPTNPSGWYCHTSCGWTITGFWPPSWYRRNQRARRHLPNRIGWSALWKLAQMRLHFNRRARFQHDVQSEQKSVDCVMEMGK